MGEPTLQMIAVVAASLSGLGAVAAALIALFQLKKMADQLSLQGEAIETQSAALVLRGQREKKWETVKACQRYTSDPNICRATKEIWRVSNNGTDYTSIDDPPHSLFLFLNYLESLCIGMEQGIYDKSIVRDNHDDTFYKVMRVFFHGESDEYRGTSWEADQSLVSEKEYPHFMRVCKEWYGQSVPLTYRDPDSAPDDADESGSRSGSTQ
jgi:hypothetical protein